MKKLAALALSLFLTTGTAFADSPKDSPKESDAQPANSAAPAKPAPAKSSAEIAAEVEALRQAVQAQQEQLQLLKEELAKRDRQIEEARETAASANAHANEANVKATQAVATSTEVKTTTSNLNATVSNLSAANSYATKTYASADPAAINSPTQAQAKPGDEEKGPSTIRFKGVNLTPGGFIEAATVNRTRALSADINTPFNSIPYNGASLGKVSEMNFTARQSRLSLLVDGKIGTSTLSGYYEADFLGAGTTSNNRQSNSYVFRQRQLWGQIGFQNGLTISGGQMWSLVTENKKGISLRGEATTQQIDPQYVVGFDWQRSYGFRVTKKFSDQVAAAFAVEGPQTTIGGRGFSTYTNTSATGAVTTYQNFWVDAPGNGGGLYNAFDPTGYSVNKLPDFIAKIAIDPKWGHFEVYGIFSDFRNRVYPCAVVGVPTSVTGTTIDCPVDGSTAPSAKGAYNDSRFAGGLGVSMHGSIIPKKLDFGLKTQLGDGIGRFGSAQLADATARPDGTIAPIRNLTYLAQLEANPSPKWQFYAYYGGEMNARAAYTGYYSVKVTNTPAIPAVPDPNDPTGPPLQPAYPATSTTTTALNGVGGYGSPFANNSGCATEVAPGGTSVPGGGGTCAGDTRFLWEFTLGFWNKIYSGEKGRLQWGLQYSYFSRYGYSGNAGLPSGSAGISPHASDNMFWTSFRYYIP